MENDKQNQVESLCEDLRSALCERVLRLTDDQVEEIIRRLEQQDQ